MAAPVTDPAIAPAALSVVVFPATDDGDFVERGASETATVCLVTVTTELFGIVCVTPESAFLAGEGEGAGAGNEDEDEEEEASESPQSNLSSDLGCNPTPTTTQIPPGGMVESHTYRSKYK
ncbi:hypothetical protein E4U39_001369 [Claviceps sp. Clav50 group G5]|nr:hypothetical protein E4U39_001369 [Claviceps sp. Clav50 group G5]